MHQHTEPRSTVDGAPSSGGRGRHPAVRSRRRPGAALLLALVAGSAVGPGLASAPEASAHAEHRAGDLRLTMGWGREPAYSGSENFVQVAVSDRSGAPVADLAKPLTAEVFFADARVMLPLVPAGRPGELRAALTPTRSGVYSFRIAGQVRGHSIDEKVTCSEGTFDCVADASEVQFPVKDPSSGQVAQKLDRTLPRARRTAVEAESASNLATGAIVVALLAFTFAVAGALGMRVRAARKLA